MNRGYQIGFLVGLAAIIGFVAWSGVEPVVNAFLAGGPGLAFALPFHLAALFATVIAWQLLFDPQRRPGFGLALKATWIGSAVNNLLPVATLGGEFVRLRLLMKAGMAAAEAGASLVLDRTIDVAILALWALIGVVLLVQLTGAGEMLVLVAAAGTFLLFVGLIGFVLAQQAGIFGAMANLTAWPVRRSAWLALVGDAAALDEAVVSFYRRPASLFLAGAFRLFARLAFAAEVWLFAVLMGAPIGFAEAIMLRSLTAAMRGMAFVIPGGLGVQEAGMMLLGMTVGLSPELALAVSLATRARELIYGIPGLISWYRVEARGAKK